MYIKIIKKVFKKTWYIYVIILAYILAGSFSLIPPRFNIFKKDKIELIDTPVLVKEIKEIGELICAEYYGEVYADLFEAYDEILKVRLTEKQLLKLYEKYKYLEKYKELLDNQSNNEDVAMAEKKLQELQKQGEDLSKQIKDYSNGIDSLQIVLSGLTKRKDRDKYKEVNKKIKDNQKLKDAQIKEQKQINKVIITAKTELTAVMQDSTFASRKIMEFKKKNNLVYIGRGTVIAGINLMKLHDGNIDTLNRELLSITIPRPKIIDTIINPWFIKYDDLLEEKKDKKKIKTKKVEGVLGYEIVINKGNNYTYDDISLIKYQCIKKLADAAVERNILQLAEKSANDALGSFFSLLGFKNVNIKFVDHEVKEKKKVIIM